MGEDDLAKARAFMEKGGFQNLPLYADNTFAAFERLKTEAVFWKREEGPSGSRWIEPTEADYADRGRWE